MAQPFEDFLIDLAKKNDPSVLGRIDIYLDGHFAQFSDHRWGYGSVAAERERLIVAFRDKAPRTDLSQQMLERIINHGGAGASPTST